MLQLILLFACLPAPATTASPATQPAENLALEQSAPTDDGRGTPYKVDKADNICGLLEPRQLTSPAKVDYQALLEATSEYQEITKNKIDPNSAKGIELLTKARTRIRDACEAIRVKGNYCSIWKVIERRDGTAVDDITDQVKKAL
ncbi:MAG: hypothetical protein H6830_11580 [Planctomycetes bacterium]|nr:hypothetical protein [Planctomycetota bacterium]MCB9908691.1 hypothetical protein [Planctomycetota bacterium]MCB9913160.1 hypothetical protein [Planctomycetota bacterium]HPF13806.1 hypothetical protein [Planctomycetota bacterium]HRV81684.1 hypothetical protein [Planctomycetota bacterium]